MYTYTEAIRACDEQLCRPLSTGMSCCVNMKQQGRAKGLGEGELHTSTWLRRMVMAGSPRKNSTP